MLDDFVSDKFGEISKAVRKRRGEDIPEEQAEAVQAEILSVLETMPEERNLTVEQVLRLYVPHFFPGNEPIEDIHHVTIEDAFDLEPIRIWITSSDYQPDRPFPLIIERPIDLLGLSSDHVRIRNLRRFLADYQSLTGTWLGAKDILNATVKQMFMDSGLNRYRVLVLVCEI